MGDAAVLQGRVSQLLREYRIPSAAVGVLRDSEISVFAVGVRNVTTREPATTDTIYQLGSMSKTWTALAFMQLVDEGRVDLDEPVRAYLPGFRVADPIASAGITPRHLLNHANGIEEAFGDPGEGDDAYERMVADIADAPQVFPVGATHGYSASLGYAILARIMEVLDDRPWDAVMRARLFDPMGLTSTSSLREDVERDRAATGHVLRSLAEGPIVAPVPYLPRLYGPGGNVSSTAMDVLTMAEVFLNGGVAPNGACILSPASIREMTESRVPVPDPYMHRRPAPPRKARSWRQSTGETRIRLPSGSATTKVRPNTSSCGSSTTRTPFFIHWACMSSIRAAPPKTMSPTSLTRGVDGTACSL
jgi:CubicO group peptidase (beta-lactamase class C family)